MFRQIPVTLTPYGCELLKKPAQITMVLPTLPPSFLDDLFSGNLTDEEKQRREDYILNKISHFEEVLRILDSSKLSDSAKKQLYELVLASNEYVIADFCWALFHCSVVSLRKYQTEIINFFIRKCKFSSGTSNYLFNCFVKKHPFQIDIEHKGTFSQPTYHFLATTMPLRGSSYESLQHIQIPLPESTNAYGRNFKKDSFVKYMLIYHFLRFQCFAPSIARMLKEFHIDIDTSGAQIRCIKSEKRKEYRQNLDYILPDLEEVFALGISHYSDYEWIELFVKDEQFRFKPNNA